MSRKKGKSKAKGSSARSTPRRNSPHLQHQSASSNYPSAAAHMSLADEARWMSTHRTTAYEANKKLRDLPVQFISAGRLQGTIEERQVVVDHSELASTDQGTSPVCPPPTHIENVDAMARMAIRSPSPAASESSSSADEVVFRGRGQTDPTHSISQNLDSATVADNTKSQSLQLDAPLSGSQLSMASCRDGKSTAVQDECQTTATMPPDQQDVDSDTDGVVQELFEKRRGGKPAWEGATTPWEHRSKPGIGWQPTDGRPSSNHHVHGNVRSRNAAMDDYMQNIEDFGLAESMTAAPGFARREMDLDAGSHNDWEMSDRQHGKQDEYFVDGDENWDSDMIQDFADISTSSDVAETVVLILSKRTRRSGLHYLCVYEDSSIDDAVWLPSTFLTTPHDQKLICHFEQTAARAETQPSDESTSEVASSSKDDEEEEEFDDETIARVLQKQEDLGLDADEVLLFGRDESFSNATTRGSNTLQNPRMKQKPRARRMREQTFPSASAMADALAMDPYGGFDIMDTERPSLKVKKKGRRGHMPPELEDDEMSKTLQNTWQTDRDKKRLKKAEREELRQQGLLGRKGKAPDLNAKYQGGIGMQDIVEEIQKFLFGNMESLALPPMDKHRRKAVHEMGLHFGLGSRSRGAGANRFTVLWKYSRNRVWTDADFYAVIQHKGFARFLQEPSGGRANKGPFRSYVGYRDGDTVGADAPELGPENKGHALLKKMGWSKGVGLGALDNKGILQPIPHVVKTNRAGLQ
ncbi:hypothetical protein IQ07DRAFT_590759 [Pyrenochaeta sp. DS3sAY3a]|nr:hypothetical protein IQ07DRAFT_590759 [Pyrenochaeta sp. DS3sAY3a]